MTATDWDSAFAAAEDGNPAALDKLILKHGVPPEWRERLSFLHRRYVRRIGRPRQPRNAAGFTRREEKLMNAASHARCLCEAGTAKAAAIGAAALKFGVPVTRVAYVFEKGSP
jgi:hypothetical protein